jgi:hypothetical protein
VSTNEGNGTPEPGRPTLTSNGCRATKLPQSTTEHQRHNLTAVAFVAVPSGRRTLHTLVVPRCPVCSCMHFHKARGPHGGQRKGSCGAVYVVVIAGRGRGVG